MSDSEAIRMVVKAAQDVMDTVVGLSTAIVNLQIEARPFCTPAEKPTRPEHVPEGYEWDGKRKRKVHHLESYTNGKWRFANVHSGDDRLDEYYILRKLPAPPEGFEWVMDKDGKRKHRLPRKGEYYLDPDDPAEWLQASYNHPTDGDPQYILRKLPKPEPKFHPGEMVLVDAILGWRYEHPPLFSPAIVFSVTYDDARRLFYYELVLWGSKKPTVWHEKSLQPFDPDKFREKVLKENPE